MTALINEGKLGGEGKAGAAGNYRGKKDKSAAENAHNRDPICAWLASVEDMKQMHTIKDRMYTQESFKEKVAMPRQQERSDAAKWRKHEDQQRREAEEAKKELQAPAAFDSSSSLSPALRHKLEVFDETVAEERAELAEKHRAELAKFDRMKAQERDDLIKEPASLEVQDVLQASIRRDCIFAIAERKGFDHRRQRESLLFHSAENRVSIRLKMPSHSIAELVLQMAKESNLSVSRRSYFAPEELFLSLSLPASSMQNRRTMRSTPDQLKEIQKMLWETLQALTETSTAKPAAQVEAHAALVETLRFGGGGGGASKAADGREQGESTLIEELTQWLETQQDMHDRFTYILENNALDLKADHREDLHRRGLSDGQIQSCGFRRWPGGPICVPSMAGCSRGGDLQLISNSINMQPGMLIPARNPEGMVTALHLKPDFDKKNKYTMVSQDRSVHLDGEDPLYCNVPQESRRLAQSQLLGANAVLLIEGGLKSHVFALLLDHAPVIGATGGSFWRSPRLLREYLVRLEADTCILVPDAGATQNSDVILSYMRLFQLLEEWGMPARVLWWGQHSKEQSMDADDLLASHSDNRSNANESIPPFTKVTVEVFFWKLCTEEVQTQMLLGKRHRKRLPRIISDSPNAQRKLMQASIDRLMSGGIQGEDDDEDKDDEDHEDGF